MTIRYTCVECSSVLKIRDELAGTNAKCPKCKMAFVVPSPKKQGRKPKPGKSQPAAAFAIPSIPMVDMPTEVTPKVNVADTDLLEVAREAAAVAAPAATAPEAPKPSIAELMREHEEAKKKKSASKAKPNSTSAVSGMVTSGSAADVLTRNYDQKRGQSSDPAPMTRDERRAAEQKEALQEFAKKMWPVALGVAFAIYGLFWFMNREPLPALGYPRGIVTQNGQPASNLLVEFTPVESQSKLNGQVVNTVSSAYTDEKGEFIMMYDEEKRIEGAVIGTHRISVRSLDGITFNLPPALQSTKVEEGASSTVNLNL